MPGCSADGLIPDGRPAAASEARGPTHPDMQAGARRAANGRPAGPIGEVAARSSGEAPSSDETERLAALRAYDVLDTPAEPEFDDIARLAAEACGAPVALVSLVAERRQWFKARVGFDPSETPLDAWRGRSFLPRSPESLQDLDLLLVMLAKPRCVRRDGIHFQGLRYIDPVLAAYVGETVTIRYDPRDAAELRVFHNDQYLCRAIAPELATAAITLEQLQTARDTRRRNLKQQLRDRRSLADALPEDHRYLPDPAERTAAGTDQQPQHVPDSPAPRHRLRTFAID